MKLAGALALRAETNTRLRQRNLQNLAMADLENRLDHLVEAVVVPTLKPRGYAKRKLSWVRKSDDLVLSITFQRSHGNSAEHLRRERVGARPQPLRLVVRQRRCNGNDEQIATAQATFGHEERWPRLYAQFERVAQRFGVSLPGNADELLPSQKRADRTAIRPTGLGRRNIFSVNGPHRPRG